MLKYIAQNNEIYLKKRNGALKSFKKVLEEVLGNNFIKFKNKYFYIIKNGKRIGCKSLRNMSECDEIWISTLSPQKVKEKSLIYEVAGIHYEDEDMIREKEEAAKELEEITSLIYKNKNYRKLVREALVSVK